MIHQAYVHEVSARSVDELVKALGGGGLSNSQVIGREPGDKTSAIEVTDRLGAAAAEVRFRRNFFRAP